MKLANLLHPGKEWDEYTHSWVRRGWIAERQGYMDRAYDKLVSGEDNGGTCIDCNLPIRDHPLPDRMWRRGPDLCAAARVHVE